MKRQRKRFDLQISEAGARFKGEFELEKTLNKVLGLTLSSDSEAQLYHRGSQKIELGGTEIFPEGYESKLLLTGMNLAPKDRFFPLEVEVGNGLVSLTYQDSEHPDAPFSPYRVSLYLEVQ